MSKDKDKNLWDLPTKGSYDTSYDVPYNTTICGSRRMPDSDPDPDPFGKTYWEWSDNKSYDEWQWERVTPSLSVYNDEQYDAEEIKKKWSGALVKFSTYLYARSMGVNIYDPGNYGLNIHSENSSRKDLPHSADVYRHTGTVFEVDSRPNYRGQWCVSVLWSDGMISYENILDLEIIQAKT